jgi:membrane protease YdiL (CAAX protease family)
MRRQSKYSNSVTAGCYFAEHFPEQDYDMTDIANPEALAPEAASPRSGYWKFWGTTLWLVAIIAAYTIVGTIVVVAGVVWLGLGSGLDLSKSEIHRQLLFAHGALPISTAIGAAAASAFAVLALAVRLSRIGMRDYLGLVLPQWRDVMIGLAGFVMLFIVFLLIKSLVGESLSPKFVIDLYHDAYSLGYLPAMVMGLVVLAPVMEELLVRGFLLRGWAASRLGPTGAILLTSAIWMAGHISQYDVLILIWIFMMGLLFGWLRQRSGSTLLTIFLHAMQNTAALIQVAILYPPAN